jgi:nucleotide-binding universal stress UspA family protein
LRKTTEDETVFERILLAVDESDYSRRAVPAAVDIAKKSGGEIVVFHVREHATYSGVPGGWELESKEKAHGLVEGLKREIEAAGVPVKAEVRRRLAGRVPQAILDAADEHEADLVVMGSRGVSDLRGLLLGSVTHKVLQLSDRAVLVAR